MPLLLSRPFRSYKPLTDVPSKTVFVVSDAQLWKVGKHIHLVDLPNHISSPILEERIWNGSVEFETASSIYTLPTGYPTTRTVTVQEMADAKKRVS